MSASLSAGRARFYYLADAAAGLWRLPLKVLLGLLKGLYLIFCMCFWILSLWVLREKHLGVLKILIFFSCLAIWGGIIILTFSLLL